MPGVLSKIGGSRARLEPTLRREPPRQAGTKMTQLRSEQAMKRAKLPFIHEKLPGMSMLETALLKPASRRQYEARLSEFTSLCPSHRVA